MRQYPYLFSLVLLALTSCIGTDLVDEPLGPVPSRLELSHASIVLLQGESQQLSAQVIGSDESIFDEPISWSSRNNAVATVDASGLLSAVGTGQVWIDVSSPSLMDSLLVTVSLDLEALASVVIASSQTEISIGDTLQFSILLSNANGDMLSGRAVTWESSSPEVCAVDANGLVTALANGTTQITAFSEGVKSLPISLMVGAPSFTRTGSFVGLNGYRVQGSTTLDRSASEAVLTLGSDFSAQNGPGLYVYLSPNSSNVSGGLSLGTLKSTSGEQSYAIPSNVNPDDFDHVIIYCQPFGVPFGGAMLE